MIKRRPEAINALIETASYIGVALSWFMSCMVPGTFQQHWATNLWKTSSDRSAPNCRAFWGRLST
jgi:hypothetical protein